MQQKSLILGENHRVLWQMAHTVVFCWKVHYLEKIKEQTMDTKWIYDNVAVFLNPIFGTVKIDGE